MNQSHTKPLNLVYDEGLINTIATQFALEKHILLPE